MNEIVKDEIKRKSFHLLMLLYTAAFWYLPKKIVVLAMSAIIILVGILEWSRFTFPKFNEFFVKNFKGLYRKEEINKISGLIWTLSGALFAMLLFKNREFVLASFLYLAFGDSSAALIGRVFGKHKIIGGKSLEGSAACFLSCFTAGLFLFNLPFALFGAMLAAFIEAVPWKLNDNFWMQIVNAGLLTALSLILPSGY